jgi:hypothetical protein
MDLIVITLLYNNEQESKTCTHRPSLSSKDEISRNKVGLTEVEPIQNIAYT